MFQSSEVAKGTKVSMLLRQHWMDTVRIASVLLQSLDWHKVSNNNNNVTTCDPSLHLVCVPTDMDACLSAAVSLDAI
jgi:hypothetical protein